MKILVAGSTGAVGRPLIDHLIKDGHEVYGITHSQENAQILAGRGAKPLLLNILEQEAVQSTVANVRPDVIVDMLTSLPQEYTPDAMRKAAEMDEKVRREGGSYLQAAGEANGVQADPTNRSARTRSESGE